MPADLPIQSHLTILRTVHVGSFVSAVQKISYLNPQILKVLPDKYLDGPRYVAPCALARFERTGWQAVNVADKNAPRISLTLGEVLQQVSELTLDGQPCRPMLPRELAWLFAAMPHLQLQLQIVGLGYLLYSADEDRYRALVLGGGETTALDPPDPVHSLFYNLANYNIGPGTFVGVTVSGCCPDEDELLEPYNNLLLRIRSKNLK